MVGIGTALMGLAAWLAFVWWRRRDIPETKWFLRAVAVSGIGAVIALESGWIVTEVGRQPWIVYQQMRTSEAVTDAGGLWFAFGGAVLLYAALGFFAVVALRRVFRDADAEAGGEGPDADLPYGPPPQPASSGGTR
jgi:cytochrome d ubiquinol oxidase subunit I